MVTIKRPEEVERMRRAGLILAEILEVLGEQLRPGMATAELDATAER
jgi:methionyl aminopeptidase